MNKSIEKAFPVRYKIFRSKNKQRKKREKFPTHEHIMRRMENK